MQVSALALISRAVGDPPAGDLNDLHMYYPANMSWTDLSTPASGVPPSPRWGHGFAALNGLFYAFAGCTAPNANGYCAAPHGVTAIRRLRFELRRGRLLCRSLVIFCADKGPQYSGD